MRRDAPIHLPDFRRMLSIGPEPLTSFLRMEMPLESFAMRMRSAVSSIFKSVVAFAFEVLKRYARASNGSRSARNAILFASFFDARSEEHTSELQSPYVMS